MTTGAAMKIAASSFLNERFLYQLSAFSLFSATSRTSVIEAVHAREVVELFEHERADAACRCRLRMHRELVDEQRTHLALLEVARVDPVVAAEHLVAALRVRDDLASDLEDELVDALFFEDLLEAVLAARPLILDGLRIDVAKADLQELPHAVDVAPVHVADAHLRLVGLRRRLLAAFRGLRRRGLRRFDAAGLPRCAPLDHGPASKPQRPPPRKRLTRATAAGLVR